MAGQVAATTRNLGRHKTLLAAGGLVVLAWLYLRSRAPATAVAGTTDPNSLNTPPTATDGTLTGLGNAGSSPATEALAAALEGLQAGLGDLQTQQAQDEAAIQSASEAAAQVSQAWNDVNTLGMATVPASDGGPPVTLYKWLPTGPNLFSGTQPGGVSPIRPVGYAAPAELDPFGTYALQAMLAARQPAVAPYESKRGASSPTPAATVPTASAPILQLASVASPGAVTAAQPHAAEYVPPARSAVVRGAVAA